jgi:hypothetical protein
MNHRAALATLVLALSTCWPLAASAQGPSAIKGEVLEVQNVEGYTYLRLKTLARRGLGRRAHHGR